MNHNPWPGEFKRANTTSVISVLKRAGPGANGWLRLPALDLSQKAKKQLTHSFWKRQGSYDPAWTSGACSCQKKRGGSQAERTAQAKAWVCRGPWRCAWKRSAERREMGLETWCSHGQGWATAVSMGAQSWSWLSGWGVFPVFSGPDPCLQQHAVPATSPTSFCDPARRNTDSECGWRFLTPYLAQAACQKLFQTHLFSVSVCLSLTYTHTHTPFWKLDATLSFRWVSGFKVSPLKMFFKNNLGASLLVQWLRLCAPKTGGLGSIPGQGTRSHTPQLGVCMLHLKVPSATTDKTQPNKLININSNNK